MASQQSLEEPLKEPLVDLVSEPPASDDRWLLSCRFDVVGEKEYPTDLPKKLVVALKERINLFQHMLGEGVVNNPNRFSKTCCTVGEEWDDNYNKGDNAEKYLRCWEPGAPEELRCTKPVATGKEPTLETCWKSSYFWRLKKCRKMLRIKGTISDCDEETSLGEGQQIEKNMADYLQREAGGCEVRIIDIRDENKHDSETIWRFTRKFEYSDDPRDGIRWMMGKKHDHIDDKIIAHRFLCALIHARELSENGFGNPFVMMIRTIKSGDECCLPVLAARVIEFQENDGFLVSEFYQKVCSELKSESSFKTILGELQVIHGLPEFDGSKFNDDPDELMTHLCGCAGHRMLMAWCVWRWDQEKTVGLPSGESKPYPFHWSSKAARALMEGLHLAVIPCILHMLYDITLHYTQKF
mmetsp:Transcript_158198/g.288376  ORF Transcript_158198/g.288376 Transcript_158198/m.288376 type:complete len:411 (+) Transcript_158198:141-1373(+)